jgi:hypothetical protein
MKIFIAKRAILNINDNFFPKYACLAIGTRHGKIIQPNFNLNQNPVISIVKFNCGNLSYWWMRSLLVWLTCLHVVFMHEFHFEIVCIIPV